MLGMGKHGSSAGRKQGKFSPLLQSEKGKRGKGAKSYVSFPAWASGVSSQPANERAEAGEEGREPTTGRLTPGSFSRIYVSRDDALHVFEDAEGHLTSVNSARFA